MLPGYSYFLLTFLAALLGSLTTTTDSEWYRSLVLPDLQPPGQIFGIAWTILYIIIAIAGYLGRESEELQVLFLIQLVLNYLWTLIFFRLNNPILSLIVLALLLSVTAVWMVKLYQVSPVGGFLIFVYVGWLSFATYLNYQVIVLNPDS